MIRPTPPNHIRRAGGKRLHQLGEEVISFASLTWFSNREPGEILKPAQLKRACRYDQR